MPPKISRPKISTKFPTAAPISILRVLSSVFTFFSPNTLWTNLDWRSYLLPLITYPSLLGSPTAFDSSISFSNAATVLAWVLTLGAAICSLTLTASFWAVAVG